MTINKLASCVIVVALLLSFLAAGQPANQAVALADPDQQLAYFSGDLNPGETVVPTYQLFGGENKQINLALRVPAVAGSGSVDLAVTDSAGGTAFTGTIWDGEKLWATPILTPGVNTFSLHNSGGTVIGYELWLYEIESAPYTWNGTSLAAGTWRSHIRLDLPSSALYQFDLGLTGGNYQFLIDGDYLQKTVETAGLVTYFVPAGIHDLYVIPDTHDTESSWSVGISAPGSAVDPLPYSKSGGNLGGAANDFAEEWLPINLATGVQANFSLSLGGDEGDTLDVRVYGGLEPVPLYTITDVRGGETVWWTTDLPAGVSRVQLVAGAGNVEPLTYELTGYDKPAVPASWSGTSAGFGNNSQLRFEVPQSGLYDLVYGVGPGRYQFIVDPDSHVQKTVEVSGTVRYYLPAGTHELVVVQDPGVPSTSWSLGIEPAGVSHDTLPYTKTGGNLGGAGNAFAAEWLPVYVAAGEPANFRLGLTGTLTDGLTVALYHGSSSTPVYVTPVVYGGEVFWWTAPLAAGLNRIQLLAGSNALPLQYDITIDTISSPPVEWSGVAKGLGGHSIAQVETLTAGLYHIDLDNPAGFGQVLIDGERLGAVGKHGIESPGHQTAFDVPLAAGLHTFKLQQATAPLTTSWTISITETTADEIIAHIAGDLTPGEAVDPQVPLFGGADMEVNLRLFVPAGTGSGHIDLEVIDGAGGLTFAGTILDGETLWATAVLRPGQNTFHLHNTSGEPLAYDLTVYEIGTAPYGWAGESRETGTWHSHIKLAFPEDALYELGAGLVAGRYQLLVDDQYIAKIVEAPGSVTYFVPAGVHLVTVVQNGSPNTSWALAVSAPGSAADSLPYVKSGGHLWATSAQFNQEWLPINLATGIQANFSLSLGGSPTDSLDVYVYGPGPAPIHTLSGVYGGETVWWTTDLPAGVSRVQLVAGAGNVGPLTYELTGYDKPAVPASWSGTSAGFGNNSQLRFEVPQSGLYDLVYGVGPGRYQFIVDPDSHVQKTVEVSGTVRYYLPAGTHELVVVQDPGVPSTSWSLGIEPAGVSHDTLPYTKTGGNLGGAGNAFAAEWLPVYVAAGEPANFRLGLTGTLTDGLTVALYHGSSSTPVYVTPVVYGGEVFWWTAPLAAGLNRIQLLAGSNALPLQYDITILPVPVISWNNPYSWSGVSKGSGAHSEIMLDAPMTAMYHVVGDVPQGFANVFITGTMNLNFAPDQTHFEFNVPLDKGSYLFQVLQSANYEITTWTITVSMLEAPVYHVYLPMITKGQ